MAADDFVITGGGEGGSDSFDETIFDNQTVTTNKKNNIKFFSPPPPAPNKIWICMIHRTRPNKSGGPDLFGPPAGDAAVRGPHLSRGPLIE